MVARFDAVPSPVTRQVLRTVATAFLRQRPFIVAPMFAIFMVTLALGPGPRRQLALMASVGATALCFFAWEAWRGRTQLVTPAAFFRSLVATVVVIACGAALTGGADSPLLFMALAPVVIAFAAFGRGLHSNSVLLLALAALFALALLPANYPFDGLPERTRRLLVVVCAADALVLLRVGVAALTDAHATARHAAAGAGEDAIASAAARAAALEAMGAKVAHEVRNPLSAIRGLVEVQAEKLVEDKDRQRLTVVLREVDRIDDILRGYLAMARPLDQVVPKLCELAQLVREVAAITEARAEAAAVTLVVEAVDVTVRVDPRRMKEALLNLVLNSLEHTGPGGRITLRVGPTAVGVSVCVEDSGVGMDAARLQAAGTPYASGRVEGNGLGLALARQAVEQHGGTLELTSAVGKGTTAVIKLPQQQSEAS